VKTDALFQAVYIVTHTDVAGVHQHIDISAEVLSVCSMSVWKNWRLPGPIRP